MGPRALAAQAPAKLRWWAGAHAEGWLNGSAIPVPASTADAKLAARGYRIDLCRRFARASLS